MKRTMLSLTIILAVVTLIAAFSCPATAAVKGRCDDCHTMHNSQGAAPMRWDEDTKPLSALLRGTCLGCHTTDKGDPYGPINGANYPYVMSSSDQFDDDTCLAGGFFDPTKEATDNNSDNHHSLGTKNLPAGYASDEELGDWYEGDTAEDGFACAGSNGCHGRHDVLDDMEAIKGGHHNPTAYRMLYVSKDMSNGVLGIGAPDYEEDLIATPSDTDPRNTYSAEWNDPSISRFCAICHGNFHNELGTTDDCGEESPWLRHPTDVLIPGDWLIGDEGNDLTGSDYKNNPVGYDGADDSGERMATCLSCHRAHGTENDDLLRWSYTTQQAGSTTVEYGCLGCHDKQRGS